MQENLFYYYNDHLHTTLSKILNINPFILYIIAILQVMSLYSVTYVQKGYMVNNLVNICC